MQSETFGFLKAYMTSADQLVASATKDDLAECARILAVNVAHYASRYGELPIEEHLDFLNVESLSDEQAKFVQQENGDFRWGAWERDGAGTANALASKLLARVAMGKVGTLVGISSLILPAQSAKSGT